MTLFDTTELKRPTQRKLHAAWQEIGGEKVRMTESTAIELAPMAAAPTGGPNGLSAAEDELARRGDALTNRRRNQLLQQAWWATMWRSEDAPFQLVELNETQNEVCDRILERIDPRCFPRTGPEEYFDVGDPRIVAEAMAMGAKVLLTSDLKTIDRFEVNRWAVENAEQFGLEPGPVVFDADATLLEWTKTPVGHQLLLQAALLATWPGNDNMPALNVIENTEEQLQAVAAGQGGKLKGTVDRIHNGFEYHPDPERLVESTRRLLPSATVETDRLHSATPHPSRVGLRPVSPATRIQASEGEPSETTVTPTARKTALPATKRSQSTEPDGTTGPGPGKARHQPQQPTVEQGQQRLPAQGPAARSERRSDRGDD